MSENGETKSHKKRAPSIGDPVLVRLQPKMAKLVDDWRRGEPDIPGRAEAIRRLIEAGLREKKSADEPASPQFENRKPERRTTLPDY